MKRKMWVAALVGMTLAMAAVQVVLAVNWNS